MNTVNEETQGRINGEQMHLVLMEDNNPITQAQLDSSEHQKKVRTSHYMEIALFQMK